MQTDFEPVRAWIAQDIDPETVEQAQSLLDQASDPEIANELRDRFTTELSISADGTCSLVEAGSNRINQAVVARMVAALCRYVEQSTNLSTDTTAPIVVVGYDNRESSLPLALTAVRICAGLGVRGVLLPHPTPSALLAFAVHHFQAEAGVMVSGGKFDLRQNGVKMFLGGRAAPANHNGALLAPAAAGALSDIARALGATNRLPRSENFTIADEKVIEAYFDHCLTRVTDSQRGHQGHANLKIVIGACGGNGAFYLQELLKMAGFTNLVTHPKWCVPELDGSAQVHAAVRDKEASTELLNFAKDQEADLCLNLSSDASRVTVGIAPNSDSTTWRYLDADEVALLCLDWLDTCPQTWGGSTLTKTKAFVSTVVCSNLPRQVAHDRGYRTFAYPQGFALMARQGGVRFAYQQADGFCLDPTIIRDADGIYAALIISHLAAEQKTRPASLNDLLADHYLTYGLHATVIREVSFPTVSKVERFTRQLRSGQDAPDDFAGSRVLAWCDLARPCPHGSGCPVRESVGKPATPLDAIGAVGAGGERLIVRGHPKSKRVIVHAQVKEAMPERGAFHAARLTAVRRAREIIDALLP